MKSSTKYALSSSETKVTKILLGIFLMFFCSQVSIPLEPVPVTLQTVGVLIIGLTYNKKDAIFAMGGYLLLGAIGAPVFAGFSGGLAKFFLSTGGYLVGMLVSVYVMTSLREKYGNDSVLKLMAYSILGLAIIYALGISWLAHLIGMEKAIQFGLLPFIVPGMVKCLFTASSIRILKNIPRN